MGSLVPLAISLVSIPIYLKLIGQERYGILAIFWLLLGYFGIFDMGLGRATAQRISSLNAASSIERAKAFWTALTINFVFGVVGGLCIWPISYVFFDQFFKTKDILRPELQNSIYWLMAVLPVATLSGVLSGALQGRSRFLDLNIISILGSVFLQIAPLVVAWIYGPSLTLILPTVLFTRVVMLIALFLRCYTHVIGGHAPVYDKSQAGELLRFGGWVTVTAFVGPLMVMMDRFVIGAVLGAKAVTVYTVPFQIGERTTLIPNALTTSLFPRFAAVDIQERNRLLEKSTRVIAVIMTPVIIIAIAMVEPFLNIWLGADFAVAASSIGKIFLVGFWISGFSSLIYSLLQSTGRPDLSAKCHLIELLPYWAALYIGVKHFGLLGAALAFVGRCIFDVILLALSAHCLKSVYVMARTPAILVTMASFAAFYFQYSTLEWWVSVLSVVVISILWSWSVAPDSLYKRLNRKGVGVGS